MAIAIQFVNTTADSSNASQKAQKQLVNSHVASRRELLKRLRNVHRRPQATRVLLPYEETILPAAQFAEYDVEASPENKSRQTEPRDDKSARKSRRKTSDQRHRISNKSADQIKHKTRQRSVHEHTTRPSSNGDQLPPFPEATPDRYLGQGSRDWFVWMPPKIEPRMPKHLFYYVNVIMPKLHPFYTTCVLRLTYGCGMLRYADKLTLASITAFSATSRALITGDLEGTKSEIASNAFHDAAFERLYFKGQAIRLINERLNSAGGVDVTDASLCAGIASMIFIEALTGNINEASAHMNGLLQLASVWRAQNHTPLPYKVESKIIASAIKISILTNTPPFIPFTLTFDDVIPFPLPGLSHILSELGTSLLQQWPVISSNETFVPVILDLITMTRYTEAVCDKTFPYIDNDSYLEYINFQVIQIEFSLLSYRPIGVIDAACQTASLLYLNTVLARWWSNNSAVIRSLVSQLKNTLEGGATEWHGLEEVQLWVAFIGASCSHRPVDAIFFTVLFGNAVSALGLESYDRVVKMLSKSLYVGSVYADRLDRLWGAVKR